MRAARPLRIVAPLALALLAGRASRPAHGEPPRRAAPDLAVVAETFSQEVRRHLEAERIPSISAALVVGDAVVWTGAFGHANVWARTPATPETLYSTGSTFKTVVATAVMRLVERGALSLDAPVATWLGADAPAQPEGSEPITLRHLLTHTSGLPMSGNTVPLWDRALPASLQDVTAGLVADAPPARRVVYSNVGYALVARVIERATKRPFEEVVREEVLAPLGLKTVTFSPSGADVERLALPYARSGDGVRALRQVRFDVWPAGDVYATAGDLGRFVALHLAGGEVAGRRVLSEASAATMLGRPYFRDVGPVGFGLGFVVDDARGVFRHDGLVPGLCAELAGDRKARVGVVLLANLGEAGRTLRALAETALALLRGEPFTPAPIAPPRAGPAPDLDLTRAPVGDPVGTWGGEIVFGTVRIPFTIRVDRGAEGKVAATVDVPSQGLASAPVDVLLHHGDRLHLEFGAGTGRAVVAGTLEGDTIRGTVTQGPLRLPVEAHRAGSPAAREAEAARERERQAKARAATPSDGQPSPFVGRFEGDLDLGVQKLLLRLDVTADDAATLDIPAQGLLKGPLEDVAREGDRVRFALPSPLGRAVFAGTLRADALEGTMTQGGQTFRYRLVRRSGEGSR